MADIYGDSSLDDALSGTEEDDSVYGYEYGFTDDSLPRTISHPWQTTAGCSMP
jgi:hypothetical protein